MDIQQRIQALKLLLPELEKKREYEIRERFWQLQRDEQVQRRRKPTPGSRE